MEEINKNAIHSLQVDLEPQLCVPFRGILASGPAVTVSTCHPRLVPQRPI